MERYYFGSVVVFDLFLFEEKTLEIINLHFNGEVRLNKGVGT